jgi:hypothetical protein
VVFGSDALRIDYARTLRAQGAPALKLLHPPISAMCGGKSETQPGWAAIWSGMPSEITRTWSNRRYSSMPAGYHLIEKIADGYASNDLYVGWITGKGANIRGDRVRSPHYRVRQMIANGRVPGMYRGDRHRSNVQVERLATTALAQAALHRNFICFIHFHDPDRTGHQLIRQDQPNKLQQFMASALDVDRRIANLLGHLPDDTDVIYCSDHGFDFRDEGEWRNGHSCSPHGMLATSFPVRGLPNVSQLAVGRMIFRMAGGDPDRTRAAGGPYRIFGESLV